MAAILSRERWIMVPTDLIAPRPKGRVDHQSTTYFILGMSQWRRTTKTHDIVNAVVVEIVGKYLEIVRITVTHTKI